MHGERRDPWFLTFAPPQQWGRRRDRGPPPRRDEAVGNRRFVQCIKSRGPLDLEARRLGARLAARPRRFQALEGRPAPGGAGAQRLRRGDLGVHGLCAAVLAAGPAPAGRAAASARPRVARIPRARMLAAWRPGYSGGRYWRYHLRRSALHATMMARGTETRSSQYCERSRRARLAGVLAGVGHIFCVRCYSPDAIDARDRHEVTHRELNGSSMFMSRSILFVTDAMQPRAANDARGTTSTAQPPLPRCS